MFEPTRRELLGLLGAMAGEWTAEARTGHGRAAQAGQARFPDTVVGTTRELRRAFADLAPGETIWITDDGAPYRITEWLDIDVDGVTVVGPGTRRLIVPADGANVGGIRIGHDGHCENVEVRGVGYAGNPAGQDPSADRLHGFIVRDATDVALDGNTVTRTAPYHEHNTGGSGISVERRARNVRVRGNYVYDIGDRGVQVAGERVLVAGNVVVDGFDHSVALDAWVPDEHHARNVSVRGNLMGGNPQGALVGMSGASNQPSNGYVDVSDNVGYGRHKSLCLLGFGGALDGVQIEGNVSVQTNEDRFAGVSVTVERATNVTIRDNDLHGYAGRGINVADGVSDFAVSDNGIYDAGGAGVRVAGANDGIVTDNYVNRVGGEGVLLDGARYVTVSDNRVRRAGGAGIVARGADRPAFHEIADNYLKEFGRADGAPGVLIADQQVDVRANRILNAGGPAIVEADGAGGNRYEANRATGGNPWRIGSATSAVANQSPAVDAHRGVSAAPGTDRITVAFEKPYAERPRLAFGRVGGGVRGVSYRSNGSGAFDGVTITVAEAGGTVDLFVDSA